MAKTDPPPHNMEMERHLLGAAMLDEEAAAVAASLPVESWYGGGHQHAAAAIASLLEDGKPTDPVSVAERLGRDGVLDALGGLSGLNDIVSTCPAPSAAKHYRDVIEEKFGRRTVMAEADAALRAARSGSLTEAIGHLETAIDGSSAGVESSSVGDAVGRHLDLVEARQSGSIPVVATGLTDLDELLGGGLKPGGLYIGAGRPAQGKSVLGITIAANVARRGTPALLATLEMSETEVLDRMLAGAARIDSMKIQRGQLTEAEHNRVSTAAGEIGGWPFRILDTPDATVAQIRAEARRHRSGLVVVDYLGLVRATGKHGNRQEEVASVARGLKVLARAVEAPVLALCQLNRGLELRSEKRPQLADLRESGEIEQAADAVITVYRDEVYDPESEDRGLVELGLVKHRHGPQGTAFCAFLGQVQLIANAIQPGRHLRSV